MQHPESPPLPSVFPLMRTRFAERRKTSPMHNLWKYSPILWFLERTFHWMEYLSPANLLFGTRVEAQRQFTTEDDMKEAMLARGRKIEGYIVGWLLVEVMLAFLAPYSTGWLQKCCIVLPLFRIFEITQTAINLNIFERLRIKASDSHFVASHIRTVVLTIWNIFELMLCFGIVYSACPSLIAPVGDLLDPYYFSVVTQLTVGYGDVNPVGWGRLLAAIQGTLGFFFALVVLTRLTTFLPRSESILRHSIAEDHRFPPRPDDHQ
jgi:hypothetical protein